MKRQIRLLALIAFLATFAPSPISPVPLVAPPVLAQTPDARQLEASQLYNQAVEYLEAGQVEAAIQSWQQVLIICREVKNRQCEAATLGSVGVAYTVLRDYEKAIEFLEQSLEIAREVNEPNLEATALQSLSLAQQQGKADRLNMQGIEQLEAGQVEAAIQSWQQTLAIYQEIQDRRGQGYALGNIGVAYHSLGDYVQAIDYLEQWLEIAIEIQDRQGEQKALGNLGNTYKNLGDYVRAIDYQQQSLAIALEIKDREGEGYALGNLGNIYHSLGNYAQAIVYHAQLLVIAREIKDRKGEGAALGNLGLVSESLGNYTQAIDYHQQQLEIARELKNRETEGASLSNLGSAYLHLGDYTQTIDYLQQSLAIAREIGNRQGEAAALANLGIAYDYLGDYAQAIEYQQQNLAIVRATKDRAGEGVALNNLGATLYKSGNLSEAEKTLFSGIEVWESLRAGLGSNDTDKVSIFEEQARTYRVLQQVLIAQNKTDNALKIAERGRARAFVELVARRLFSNSIEESSLTAPTIEQIKAIAKAQNSTLVQYSIIYDGFNVQGKQQFKESELYTWVIKPTGEITFRTTDLKPLWQQHNTSLKDLVTNSRESIGVRGRGIIVVSREDEASQVKHLQQLHNLLIEPIADLLPTDPNQRVVFIPQESLFLVPFAALQDESGKYLIEKHTILTAPSIQVLELTRKQRERLGAMHPSPLQADDALVVGNPIMPSVPPYPGETPQQLPPLPGAEQEALAIASLLNTKAMIGKDATQSAIERLMPNAQLIHLATHGLLDEFRGIGSAIALTPSGGDDGLLTAEELLTMNLKAELVVLSACDTGRGRLTGDGVIGLSRSLISAGVPSVVVSLWAVPDAPTASLMTEFYRQLQQNPDKAQALRQAMITTMKQHPNPRDWAAFTLIGEAE